MRLFNDLLLQYSILRKSWRILELMSGSSGPRTIIRGSSSMRRVHWSVLFLFTLVLRWPRYPVQCGDRSCPYSWWVAGVEIGPIGAGWMASQLSGLAYTVLSEMAGKPHVSPSSVFMVSWIFLDAWAILEPPVPYRISGFASPFTRTWAPSSATWKAWVTRKAIGSMDCLVLGLRGRQWLGYRIDSRGEAGDDSVGRNQSRTSCFFIRTCIGGRSDGVSGMGSISFWFPDGPSILGRYPSQTQSNDRCARIILSVLSCYSVASVVGLESWWAGDNDCWSCRSAPRCSSLLIGGFESTYGISPRLRS